MCSVIDPDTSIRQNITAWATGFGCDFEPFVSDVQRVDIRDLHGPPQLPLQLLQKISAPGIVLRQRVDLLAQRPKLLGLWTAKGDSPGHAVPHCSHQRQICRRSGDRVARPHPAKRLGVHHPALCQIRKFEILQEQVDKLVAGQRKPEIILPVPVRTALAPGTTATAGRTGNRIPRHIFLVAGQQVVPKSAASAAAERRLVHALGRKRDLSRFVRVLDAPAGGAFVHRFADQRFSSAHEALPIGKALAARI